MQVTISRDDMLKKIDQTWAEWQAVLADVPADRMEVPAMDDWTVKDILAHITWHEREMIELVRAKVFDGSPLWNEPTEVRNQAIYREHKDLPLVAVLADHESVHAEMMALLRDLNEADLNVPGRIAQMPKEWNLALILGDNTWEHYPDHVGPLREWIDSLGG